jgi:hypothetical protein
MKNYGTVDVWTGPKDLPNTYVCRSWATRIIGVLKEDNDNEQRYMSSVLAAEKFEVAIYQKWMATKMIQASWEVLADINPFEKGIAK